MIITKSVSRFARNLLDCIGWVRKLKERDPPISGGVSKDTLLEKGGKGMAAGCAIGAAGGTFSPVVGTFAGALIGSAVGYLAGITTAFIEG